MSRIPRGKRRFVISGALVAVLLAGVAWWWIGRPAPAPEPLSVSCEDAPLPEQESDGPGPAVPSAPRAVVGQPVPAAVQPMRYLDHVPLSQRHQDRAQGYQLDHEAARVSYLRGYGEVDGVEWTRTLHSGPLAVGATIRELPGSADLLQVVGEPQNQDADLLVAAVDAGGGFHLSCVVTGLPSSDEPVPATFTPDGGVLLVPNVDEQGEEWVEAHATDGGEHLWSAPAVAVAADDRRVFLATGPSTLSAREPRSGEVVWERDVATGFDDSPGPSPTADTWELSVVDGDLYAYRRGGLRLVALDTRDGELAWELVSGNRDSYRVRITQLDDDHRVLVEMGDDLAVRGPSSRDTRWLHRGLDGTQVVDVLAPVGEPALVAIRPDEQHLTLVTDRGERLTDLALPSDDYLVAVADTMVYALHRDDRTVAGFDFERPEPVWTVPVVADGEVGIAGIQSIDGGFRVNLRNGTYIPFHGE